ncbi:MAG: hypothetical protein RL549_954 [Verrucomicrobiota bacterium]
MRLDFLILQGCVRNGGQMEHRVGTAAVKLTLPIQPGDVGCHEIASESL